MGVSPPLRVLMTADAVGGVFVYAVQLGRALCERGNRVHVVVLGPAPDADQLQQLRGVDRLSFEHVPCGLEWTDPEGTEVDAAAAILPAIARRFACDLVHLNSFREACFDWPAPVVVAAHSCVCSWWIACRGEEISDPRWAPYAEGVRAGLHAAAAWVAPTRAFADTIEQLYRRVRKGRAIYNAVESLAAPSAKEPFVLAAGRLWDEAKNVAVLADVASGLDWPVCIAGPTATEHGRVELPPQVNWLGALARADLLAEMKRASIFAAPAIYEPFGLAALEAASSGCALVLADIPTFRELWGGAAQFCDPRQPESVRAALQEVIKDGELRARLASAATARARGFSIDRMADAYQALYADTLSRTGSRVQARKPADALGASA